MVRGERHELVGRRPWRPKPLHGGDRTSSFRSTGSAGSTRPNDFEGGLGQQLWGSGRCHASNEFRLRRDGLFAGVAAPVPITGISGVDWFIRLSRSCAGQHEFPLFRQLVQGCVSMNSAQHPAGLLPSTPLAAGSTDPSGPAYPMFPQYPGYRSATNHRMPWAGQTYTLQPWVPFENWIQRLAWTPDRRDYCTASKSRPSRTSAGRFKRCCRVGGGVRPLHAR